MRGSKQGTLGVLGGMGPLASAEFLKTIYEESLGEREQDAPVVMMYCDPTFPARTEEFPNRSFGVLYERLVGALNHLDALGVSEIVICCVTMHYFLPDLPERLRGRVTSLLDVILEEVGRRKVRQLIVGSNEAREMGLLEKHARWDAAKDYMLWPDAEDQSAIARMIVRIKRNEDVAAMLPFLRSLLAKYEVSSFVVACTEIHLLAKEFERSGGGGGASCVDPLAIIAKGRSQR
jgi:aspartate racemase